MVAIKLNNVYMKDIAIFGAGGFGREIACLINRINLNVEDAQKWNLIGFFDDAPNLKGTHNEYGIVLGGMDVLNSWEKPLSIVIAIGSPTILELLVGKIKNALIEFPNLIDPDVDFMDFTNVRMGIGNVFCSRCTISTNVTLGNFNLLNVGTGVGHDAKIGNYNVAMPNVNISGGVEIGNTNLFGVKSTILQYLKVGDKVKLGAGSLLMRNAKSDSLYFGIPAEKK